MCGTMIFLGFCLLASVAVAAAYACLSSYERRVAERDGSCERDW
jgi:acetoin utilization deacetylase AcuC-like enzyme